MKERRAGPGASHRWLLLCASGVVAACASPDARDLARDPTTQSPGAASAAAPQGRVTLEGVLEIFHVDAASHERSRLEYYVVADSGERSRLLLPAELDHAPGARMRVTGERTDAGDLRVVEPPVLLGAARDDAARPLTETQAARPGGDGDTSTTSARRVAIILFNFRNDTSQPITGADAQTVVVTGSRSANSYFREQSFERVSFTGRNSPSGDVYGWYTLDFDNTPCSYHQWADAARRIAADNGFRESEYEHILHVFPRTPACTFAGVAMVGAKYSWYPHHYFEISTISHELGHNLGLNHAGTLRCTDDAGNAVTLGSSCQVDQTGDPFDIMGYRLRHMNNYHKGRLGWFGSANVRTLSGEGVYTETLRPIETSSTGVQSLRIPRDVVDGNTRYFYLEFRQPYGYDVFQPSEPVVNGVSFRLAPDHSVSQVPLLLDMTPGTASFEDGALQAGQTFVDRPSHTRVDVTSVSTAGAAVRVVVDAAAPTTPAGLHVASYTDRSVSLAWSASSDNLQVEGYEVFRAGGPTPGWTSVGRTTGTTFTDAPVLPNTQYSYQVVAYDALDNRSPASDTVAVRTYLLCPVVTSCTY